VLHTAGGRVDAVATARDTAAGLVGRSAPALLPPPAQQQHEGAQQREEHHGLPQR
jgi:hypothetical protein